MYRYTNPVTVWPISGAVPTPASPCGNLVLTSESSFSREAETLLQKRTKRRRYGCNNNNNNK